LFGQTPQFTFSTQPTEEDPRERPLRPLDVPPHFDLVFTARHGRLQDVTLSGLPYITDNDTAGSSTSDFDKATATALEGRLLYEVRDWRAVLAEASPVPLKTARAAATGSWLNELFGVQYY
jgi:lipoate---protein ligase